MNIKTLVTLVVALILGLTIMGCASSNKAIAQTTDPVNDENTRLLDVGEEVESADMNNTDSDPLSSTAQANLSPDEMKSYMDKLAQDEIPYDQVFLDYVHSSRDKVKGRFGVPDVTIKNSNGLSWAWQMLDVTYPGKKNVRVNHLLCDFDESGTVRNISVGFRGDVFGDVSNPQTSSDQYFVVGKNVSYVMEAMKNKKLYADPYCLSYQKKFRYYLRGEYDGVLVLIAGLSATWHFVSEASINAEGMREETLRPNPNIDLSSSVIVALAYGPEAEDLIFRDSLDGMVKKGLLKFVKDM